MADFLSLPIYQRGLLEVLALAVGAGLVGTWVVLRGLAFFAHAVGTAAFPGLVLADGLGFAATLGAAGTGALVALGVGLLARRGEDRADASTALVLVAALAIGIVLASDVFGSSARVETLLFGSLLLVGPEDVRLAAAASVVVVLAGLALEPRWVLRGFDPGAARALGARSGLPDVVLLGLVALMSVALLSTLGALLSTALLVVPAATTRLLCTRLRTWQAATVALVLVEGWVGLYLAREANAPPGAAIALLAGGVFAVVAVARTVGLGGLRRQAVAA